MERLAVAVKNHSDTHESEILARLPTGRYSCRAYGPEPLPADTIERMFALAQLSASWCNVQPWQVVVTRPTANNVFPHAPRLPQGNSADQPDLPYPGGCYGRSQERRRECGWRLYASVGIAHSDRARFGQTSGENFRLFRAPTSSS